MKAPSNGQMSQHSETESMGGPLLGSCFLYEGKRYFCSMGLLNIFPINCRITVSGTECNVDPIDNMQRRELMELYI